MTLRQYCVRQRVSHSRALLPMGEARGRLPGMAATIAAIYRYPVKGLSAERMDRVALLPGAGALAAQVVQRATSRDRHDPATGVGRKAIA